MKLLKTLAVVAFMCPGGIRAAETVLYDNLSSYEGIPRPHPGVHPLPGDEESGLLAQPFLTGSSDNVHSVTFSTGILKGSPGGFYTIEIWDDNGEGLPGKSVGTLGTLDIDTLSDPWQDVTVSGLVTGLETESTYFVVQVHRDIEITNDDAPIFRTTESITGTNGAGMLLGRFDGTAWSLAADFLGADRNHLLMRVTSATTASYDAAVLEDEPISYWRLNETPGSERAEDLGSTATNGSYVGIELGKPSATQNLGTAGEWVRDPGQSHIDFREFNAGSMSQLANIGDVAGAAEKFTSLEFWIKTPASGNHIQYWRTQTLFGNDAGSGGDVRWAILTPLGQLGLDILSSSFQRHLHLSNAVVSDDAWHHIVITYDWGEGISHIYIDGELDSKKQSQGGSYQGADAGIRYMGWDSSGHNNPHDSSIYVLSQFTGRLDEIAIYDHELSAARVRAHYEMAHQSENEESVRLVVQDTINGSISVSPNRESYTPASQVTLQAAPEVGYQLAAWSIGGEVYHDNPLTITLENDIDIGATFLPMPSTSLYDNTAFLPGFAMPQLPNINAVAQSFITGQTGEISAVTVGLAKAGFPGGVITAEIWSSGTDGMPEESWGEIGQVAIQDLPSIAELMTIHGSVAGLEPNTRHFLVLSHSEDTVVSDAPRFLRDTYYFRIRAGVSGTPWMAGDATNDLLLRNENGRWDRLQRDYRINAPELTDTPVFLYAEIQAPGPKIEFENILIPSNHGTVAVEPDLPSYPAGTEITLTATPRGGFEFVKWTYGDQEFTANPATITVAAGATLTPLFAPVEPKPGPEPVSVDILPAMAIRWGSQAGRTYKVQSSPDLENWTIEAEDIEGTDDTLTHFFIRDAQEMYYRVLENP